MVSQKTSELLKLLLEELASGPVSPRTIQTTLRGRRYSAGEIQDAIQLALSRSLIEIDDEMLIRRTAAAA